MIHWLRILGARFGEGVFGLVVIASLVQVFLWVWPQHTPQYQPIETPLDKLLFSRNRANNATLAEAETAESTENASPEHANEKLTFKSLYKPRMVAAVNPATVAPTNNAPEAAGVALLQMAMPQSSSGLATGLNDQTVQRIAINRASASQLEVLPGVGPKLAQRIVRYRQQHGGRIASLQQLDEVKGVGPKMLVRLEPYITF
jgi:competence ComEA-like helix-hairpin-helix protein